MGEIIKKLHPDELKACQMSLELINKLAFELGIVKRGHQHLWNELGEKHGFHPDEKLVVDYQSGYITLNQEANDG